MDNDVIRAQARTVYFEARRRGAFHLQALRVIPPLLDQHVRKIEADVEHGIPQAIPEVPSPDTVSAWADEAGWALQFDALQSSDFKDNLRSPEDQEDRFRQRLDAAATMREIASDSLRLVQEEMSLPTFVMSSDFLKRLQQASAIHERASQSEENLEDQARRRLLEIPSGPTAAADIRAREKVLLEEYGHLGPQYRIMVARLAELDFRAEAARSSGRDISTEELVKLNGAVISTIAQLQKYNESTKSESLSKDRNELAYALLSLLEGIIAPSQPGLWAQSLHAVRQKLSGLQQDERGRGILNTGLQGTVLSLVPRVIEAEPTEVSDDDLQINVE